MLAIDFDKIAEVAAKTPKHAKWGERQGKIHGIYLDGPVWEEFRRRCDERDLSVSQLVQTFMVLSLRK